MNTLFAAENLPFAAAAVLMLALGGIELIGMLVAASPSAALDSWLPAHGSDLDADAGAGMGAMAQALDWLHIGKVPSLVLLVLYLAGYAIAGFGLQALARAVLGQPLPTWLAAFAVIPAGLGAMRVCGRWFGKLIPQDESSAVSESTLIGRTGTVSEGCAVRGSAAQARVRDEHDRIHYLLVEPDIDGESFAEGAQILIVRKVGAFYRCIANPHPTLI